MDTLKAELLKLLEIHHRTITAVLAGACLLLLVLVLAGCGGQAAQAQAGTDTLTWTNPGQWSDGSPLTDAELDDILVQWGGSETGPFNQGSMTVVAGAPGAVQTLEVDRQSLGNRCYVVFAIADGVPSGASNVACKNIKGPPKSPTGLTVN